MNLLDKNYILNEAPNLISKLSKHLENHENRNKNTEHINYKIHYLLEKPFTFVNAYARISKNKGALTRATKTDEEYIKLFSLEKARKIADEIKKEKYCWETVRRVWIPKLGKKKMRPIDTPSQKDRIVQEAIRGILESIYEPMFQQFEIQNNYACTNYGFRPKKSTWDAAKNIKINCQRTTFVIEGDIKSAYNSVHHKLLIKLLKSRIKDQKFLNLIKKLLKSGIMDKGTYQHNLIGTPQGGIVSPLLFNIYMFEFDKFIHNEILPQLNTKSHRKQNPEYTSLQYRAKDLLKKWKASDKSSNAKRDFLIPYKKLQKEMFKNPSMEVSSLSKEARYYRYADDWVLLLTCSKKEAQDIKDRIKFWLKKNLHLELDESKTIINRLDNGFSFLGYRIKSTGVKNSRIKHIHRVVNGKHQRYLKRTTVRKITIYPDSKRIFQKLCHNKFCDPNLNPVARASWSLLDEYEIVLKYRQIMLGIFNYYRNCDNRETIDRASYILQYSCAKTLARRKKIPMKQIFEKFGKYIKITKQIYGTEPKHVQEMTVTYPTSTLLYKKYKNAPMCGRNEQFDPFYIRTNWRTKFKFFAECCICGNDDNVQMHHINSIQKIKQKKDQFGYIRSSFIK